MARPTPPTTHVVVPLPDDDELRAALGPDADLATQLNVGKMFAGTGSFFPVLVQLVSAVFTTPDIDGRHRETIILRAAMRMDSAYEWQANEVMARNVGLTDDEIDAIAGDRDLDALDPELSLLCRAADEAYTGHTLNDATLGEMLDAFGATLTRRYAVVLGWFSMLSLFLNITRVPLETSDKIGGRTSPLA
ncbi:carboxymuconolactone decarboxylase family protein [Leifsonia sp. AG29]|uniref:carboxymuconolactone decarboxylase family protein n=1 Tax=Leifsonia sp. AG29 TaxID=2598860 RepID=UPI00131B1945|nr:carboxymuconolactone decarboxylase family protein [Leifsonia sp. AG29]